MKARIKGKKGAMGICAGEKGATLVEYCFTVWAVAVFLIVAVSTVGDIVSKYFSMVP